jgi:hypothetical protein
MASQGSGTTFPLTVCVPVAQTGGHGGGAFDYHPGDSANPGAILNQITLYVASQRVVGIQVGMICFASNNPDTDVSPKQIYSPLFGSTGGGRHDFYFRTNETISSLSVFKCVYNSNNYVGGIMLTTSLGNSWDCRVGSCDDHVTAKVGSGICLGITGCSGGALDKLGFYMMADIQALQLKTPEPTSPDETNTPTTPITAQAVASYPYDNVQIEQNINLTHSYTATTEESWTISNSVSNTTTLGFTMSTEVFGIGVEGSSELSWTETYQKDISSSYSSSITAECTCSQTLEVGQTAVVTFYQGSGSYVMPFNASATATINNPMLPENPTYRYPTSGSASGKAISTMYYDIDFG